MNWRDLPLDEIEATFNRIDDARGLYSLEHFPESVRHLVKKDFRRHFSGEGAERSIFLQDGTIPEAINAVLGIEVAVRIAQELGITYKSAVGWQTMLRRIKAAVLGLEGDDEES